MKMTAEYSFILILLIFSRAALSLMNKTYDRDDDMNLNLCQTIQTLSKETNSKIEDMAKEILDLKSDCICAFDKALDEKIAIVKSKIADMRAGCTCSPRKLTCSEGWSLFKSTCYIYKDEKVTWLKAQNKCERLGGVLAMPASEETDKFLVNMMENINGNGYGPWLEGRRIKRKWLWAINGTQFTYTNWNVGEPNSAASDSECLHYYTFQALRWNDCTCTGYKFPYLCEKPAVFLL